MEQLTQAQTRPRSRWGHIARLGVVGMMTAWTLGVGPVVGRDDVPGVPVLGEGIDLAGLPGADASDLPGPTLPDAEGYPAFDAYPTASAPAHAEVRTTVALHASPAAPANDPSPDS
jgi:hypothetical protein